jgi:hypothetical protein
MQLLKSQKAAVFQMLESHRIDVSGVKWTEMDHPSGIGQSPAIALDNTDFFFCFTTHLGRNVAIFSPGPESVRFSQTVINWSDMLHFLGLWCSCVNRELVAPDPWAELERQIVPLTFGVDHPAATAPFDASESKKVLKTMSALQALLLDYARDNKQQQKEIKAGIAALTANSKVQDRQTFVYAVVGFLMSTAVSMALAPEQTKALFELLKAGLTGIIRLVG